MQNKDISWPHPRLVISLFELNIVRFAVRLLGPVDFIRNFLLDTGFLSSKLLSIRIVMVTYFLIKQFF